MLVAVNKGDSINNGSLFKQILRPCTSRIDIDDAISSARAAMERGEIKARDFCHILLCSDDSDHLAEAVELMRENIDEYWGRLWLFKAYFNGIGTERDIKAALHTLYSGDSAIMGPGVPNM